MRYRPWQRDDVKIKVSYHNPARTIHESGRPRQQGAAIQPAFGLGRVVQDTQSGTPSITLAFDQLKTRMSLADL